MTQLLPPKKEVALALLERSNVDVYLDPRARGVVVPPQFRKEPRLILKIGLNMPVPIPDLRLDEESMSCTLSFNRSPFYCVVPWSSVFAMVGEDGRGMVWPDDVPQELAVKVVEPGTDGLSSAKEPAAPSSASASSSSSAPSSASGGKRSSRGSKIAPDSAEPASAGGTRRAAKKKPSRKEEAPRPMLVAVPSQPQEAEAASASADRRPRPGSVPERRDGVSAIPTARTARRIPPTAPARPEGARPKRELPPYLRVVK